MIKSSLLVLCPIAVGAAIYFGIQDEDSSSAQSMLAVPDRMVAEPTAGSTDVQQLSAASISQKTEAKIVNDITEEGIARRSRANGNIWSNQSGTNEVPKQYSHLNGDGVSRTFIEIERSEIEALKKNSNFNISIPAINTQYNAKVNNVIYHPNGDKTVKAFIEGDDGERHSVTITQGEHGTFASLSTPEGAYVLEAGQRSGWIASEDDIAQSHNRSVTDEVYLTPDDSDIPPS